MNHEHEMNEVDMIIARWAQKQAKQIRPESNDFTYGDIGGETFIFFHSHHSLQKSMNMAYRLINYPCKR